MAVVVAVAVTPTSLTTIERRSLCLELTKARQRGAKPLPWMLRLGRLPAWRMVIGRGGGVREGRERRVEEEEENVSKAMTNERWTSDATGRDKGEERGRGAEGINCVPRRATSA